MYKCFFSVFLVVAVFFFQGCRGLEHGTTQTSDVKRMDAVEPGFAEYLENLSKVKQADIFSSKDTNLSIQELRQLLGNEYGEKSLLRSEGLSEKSMVWRLKGDDRRYEIRARFSREIDSSQVDENGESWKLKEISFELARYLDEEYGSFCTDEKYFFDGFGYSRISEIPLDEYLEKSDKRQAKSVLIFSSAKPDFSTRELRALLGYENSYSLPTGHLIFPIAGWYRDGKALSGPATIRKSLFWYLRSTEEENDNEYEIRARFSRKIYPNEKNDYRGSGKGDENWKLETISIYLIQYPNE